MWKDAEEASADHPVPIAFLYPYTLYSSTVIPSHLSLALGCFLPRAISFRADGAGTEKKEYEKRKWKKKNGRENEARVSHSSIVAHLDHRGYRTAGVDIPRILIAPPVQNEGYAMSVVNEHAELFY